MATGAINSALYVSGPGILFYAPLGTTEPTATVTASVFPTADLVSPWIAVGSTADGFGFSDEISTDDMQAAESFYPVKIITTGRAAQAEVVLQEWNKSNLLAALNAPTGNATVTGAGVTSKTEIVPPTVGQEIRRMWIWQSEDNTVRLIAYQVLQTGNIGARFTKGATPAGLSFTLRFELPSTGPVYKISLAGAARNV